RRGPGAAGGGVALPLHARSRRAARVPRGSGRAAAGAAVARGAVVLDRPRLRIGSMPARLLCLALVAAGCGRAADVAVCAEPWLQLEAPAASVGFDAPFRIEARTPCTDGGAVTFRQVDGPPLPEAHAEGRTFSARTHPLAALRPGPLPWGLVPLSQAERGAYEVTATWSGPGHADVSAT